MKDIKIASDEFIKEQVENFVTYQKSLPPLFDNITDGKIAWKNLENIDYDSIGKILVSHLLIETYITKYINLRIPNSFDIDSANLTFSKKLNIIKGDLESMPFKFYNGINIINKIRNRYSHNLESTIDNSEIGIIKSFLEDYGKIYQDPGTKDNKANRLSFTNMADYITIIESFTNLFCSCLAGALTVLVKHKHDNPTW